MKIYLEVVFFLEGLAAGEAFELAQVGVRDHVALQAVHVGKRLVAHLALAQVGVQDHVALQAVHVGKRLVAHLAPLLTIALLVSLGPQRGSRELRPLVVLPRVDDRQAVLPQALLVSLAVMSVIVDGRHDVNARLSDVVKGL